MSTPPQIVLSEGTIQDKAVVFIDFGFNWSAIERLQNFADATYLRDKKRWFIKKELFDITQLSQLFGNKFELNTELLKLNLALPEQYKTKLKQKRYSENTIKTYSKYFEDFINYFSEHELTEIDSDAINKYILGLMESKHISSSQQNQRINAIKFYYEKVLGREKQYYAIERPNKEFHLPDVLSKAEIKSIFESTPNLKHRCILEIIYSAGLRRGEALNLKPKDIDSKRMRIKVRGGKGKKDRYSLLSAAVLNDLRDYFKAYKPNVWLFEGQNGSQYSATSLVKVLKNMH